MKPNYNYTIYKKDKSKEACFLVVTGYDDTLHEKTEMLKN